MHPSPEPDTTPPPDFDDAHAENEDQGDGTPQVSEVALRLNLLGKLIIPPEAH